MRIEIPKLLLGLRADASDAGHDDRSLRRALRAYAAVATRPALFRTVLRAGGAVGSMGRRDWLERLPFRGAAWTDHRDLPKPAPEPFHQWWKRNRAT